MCRSSPAQNPRPCTTTQTARPSQRGTHRIALPVPAEAGGGCRLRRLGLSRQAGQLGLQAGRGRAGRWAAELFTRLRQATGSPNPSDKPPRNAPSGQPALMACSQPCSAGQANKSAVQPPAAGRSRRRQSTRAALPRRVPRRPCGSSGIGSSCRGTDKTVGSKTLMGNRGARYIRVAAKKEMEWAL